jgi:hypothetical protein
MPCHYNFVFFLLPPCRYNCVYVLLFFNFPLQFLSSLPNFQLSTVIPRYFPPTFLLHPSTCHYNFVYIFPTLQKYYFQFLFMPCHYSFVFFLLLPCRYNCVNVLLFFNFPLQFLSSLPNFQLSTVIPRYFPTILT